jgi:spectinomycin phosphotransferase
VYPFVEGQAGIDAGLTDEQWIAYGAVLKRIHTAKLAPDVAAQVNREDFVPHRQWHSMATRLHDEVLHREYANPIQRDLAAFWREKHDEVAAIIARAESLGQQLQDQSHDFVLCHADYHRGNVLLEPSGKLHVVDWDQPIYAPIERDMVFVYGWETGFFGMTAQQRELFAQGYGPMHIDPLVLDYYRTEWMMQDIGGLGAQVLVDDVGDETRADGAKWFRAMFE